ncbi:hypothetical protein ACFLYR_06130 [Chloroflexota bacterium]
MVCGERERAGLTAGDDRVTSKIERAVIEGNRPAERQFVSSAVKERYKGVKT